MESGRAEKELDLIIQLDKTFNRTFHHLGARTSSSFSTSKPTVGDKDLGLSLSLGNVGPAHVPDSKKAIVAEPDSGNGSENRVRIPSPPGEHRTPFRVVHGVRISHSRGGSLAPEKKRRCVVDFQRAIIAEPDSDENRVRIPSPPGNRPTPLRAIHRMRIPHSSDGTPNLKRGGPCTRCQKALTPQWRRGPQGPKTLCNACGIRFGRENGNHNQNQNQEPEFWVRDY